MKKKRTYKSVDVEQIDPLAIVQLVLTVGCIVAIDVAKRKFVAAIADARGAVRSILRFEHPRQTRTFLRVVEALHEHGLAPRVVMEPTGTYGDALRHQCHARGLQVEMVSPKHTHDFAEVLDGVPSMHDPKAAVVIARLAAVQPGKAWEPADEAKREMRALLDRRWPIAKTVDLYHAHLESMLARHWPELGELLDVRRQRSWMALLRQFPGPHRVAAAASKASRVLREASRGRFSWEKVASVVAAASTTLGVAMTASEEEKLESLVEAIEYQAHLLEQVDAEIAARVKSTAPELAATVGPVCAGAIAAYLDSPRQYHSAAAFEKAMGLNLKVKSSGEQAGQLHITKRGPAQVRQLLYLATLRLIHTDPVVAAWYRARGSYASNAKQKAVVAVMRKVARALWHVARGAAFDATKLFDVRRLDIAPAEGTTTEPTSAAKAPRRRKPAQPRNQGGLTQTHP